MMTWFLVTYDHDAEHSDVQSFADGYLAVDAFSQCERQHMGNRRIEVVLLAAEREEDLHVTHANFFTRGDMLPA